MPKHADGPGANRAAADTSLAGDAPQRSNSRPTCHHWPQPLCTAERIAEPFDVLERALARRRRERLAAAWRQGREAAR